MHDTFSQRSIPIELRADGPGAFLTKSILAEIERRQRLIPREAHADRDSRFRAELVVGEDERLQSTIP